MGDRFATMDMMDGKLGAVPLLGEPDPHVTQCGLGRGLRFIQPFGHNKHGPKMGAMPLFRWGAKSPSNTMTLEPRSTSLPSGSLIHPAIWPQQIWAEN